MWSQEKLLLKKRIKKRVTDNINCKRAMAKLDFTHEKTLLAAEQKAGRSIDVEVYVKTA